MLETIDSKKAKTKQTVLFALTTMGSILCLLIAWFNFGKADFGRNGVIISAIILLATSGIMTVLFIVNGKIRYDKSNIRIKLSNEDEADRIAGKKENQKVVKAGKFYSIFAFKQIFYVNLALLACVLLVYSVNRDLFIETLKTGALIGWLTATFYVANVVLFIKFVNFIVNEKKEEILGKQIEPIKEFLQTKIHVLHIRAVICAYILTMHMVTVALRAKFAYPQTLTLIILTMIILYTVTFGDSLIDLIIIKAANKREKILKHAIEAIWSSERENEKTAWTKIADEIGQRRLAEGSLIMNKVYKEFIRKVCARNN